MLRGITHPQPTLAIFKNVVKAEFSQMIELETHRSFGYQCFFRYVPAPKSIVLGWFRLTDPDLYPIPLSASSEHSPKINAFSPNYTSNDPGRDT